MNGNLINLIPENEMRTLRRTYRLRLATVACALGTVVTIVASALIVPTYLYLSSAEKSKNMQLAAIEANLSSSEESALAKRLSALETDAKTIAALSAAPSTSAIVRELLTVPRANIILSGLTYQPAAGSRAGTLAVTGTAATRNDLRAYQLALMSDRTFVAADLPVSAFAKDNAIPFTITLTLASSSPSSP